MKVKNWRLFLALGLILLSAILYLTHFLIFGDAHHIFIYLLGDIAFTPIEVLIVTLIIHRVLSDREKKAMLSKLNMVIGAFFSEVGLNLVYVCAKFDQNSDLIKDKLSDIKDWSHRDYIAAVKDMDSHQFLINSQMSNLEELREFLNKKHGFLLRLLENPNLLEHERFTELLWAVFHLSEELRYRTDLKQLPEKDYEHISGDILRVYTLLVKGWLDYMRHLKDSYPYLFSLAARINPFNKDASPIVN
ncbi:MAG: hypothetical protein K9H14_00100 [Actinomycetia bacterium]|nr:hypothetical protein [Actinomycetes bacterium]